jgi:hypothetical protein
LREVVCPVLEFTEEKRTFVKVKGGKVDFSKKKNSVVAAAHCVAASCTALPLHIQIYIQPINYTSSVPLRSKL